MKVRRARRVRRESKTEGSGEKVRRARGVRRGSSTWKSEGEGQDGQESEERIKHMEV